MSESTRDLALAISAMLLRPLVRLLTQYGVGLADWVELSKRTYVEQASAQLEREGRRVTDAALSAMTGVHRKDVRRIRTEAPLAQMEQRRSSLLDAVMSRWSGDMRFLDPNGAPRPLARRLLSSDGAATGLPTFEDLLDEVSKGVQPRAQLDAWLQQGAVRMDAEGRVCWASPERAAGEELQQFARTSRIAADRLKASWEGLHDGPAPHYLNSVRGRSMLADDVARLHHLITRWGRRLGRRLNREVALAEARGKAGGGSLRFTYGVQTYSEPDSAPGSTPFGVTSDAALTPGDVNTPQIPPSAPTEKTP